MAAFTGAAVTDLVGRGADSDSVAIARKRAVVAGALARTGYGAGLAAVDRDGVVRLLGALGGGACGLLRDGRLVREEGARTG